MSLQRSVGAGVTVDQPLRHTAVCLTVGLIDVTLIATTIFFATKSHINVGSRIIQDLSGTSHLSPSVVLTATWMAFLFLAGGYRPEVFGVGIEEFRRVFRATFWTFGTLAIVQLLTDVRLVRGDLLIAFPLGLTALVAGRTLIRRWLSRSRAAGNHMMRTLIVGTPAEIRYAADILARNPAAGYCPTAVSVVGDDDHLDHFELFDGTTLRNLGQISDFADLDQAFDDLIIAGQSAISPDELRRISWQLEKTTIRMALASSMRGVAGSRIRRQHVVGLPLIRIDLPENSGGKFVVKRILDVVVSLVALVVLSPVFVAISILIHLEDRGPVFFRQVRVGVNGKLFRITKFRSMSTDAESRLGEFEGAGTPVWKLRKDPRVTRVGSFIRAYSLDELPQLFDVLIGTMSLVGPRPQQPSEVQTYAPYMRRRLNVKPGVTGPWQVGGRSNLTWTQTVQKDLYYVENWSIVGDLVIMLKTVRAVIAKEGAY